LQELLQDANNGIDEVARLLRRDTGLTARVVRIANGIVYNKGDPVASLDEALGRVGFNEVYRLAGMASLAQLASFQPRWYPVSAARLRESSLYTALLMEEFALSSGENPRVAFTAGLMRSVGKIALDTTAQRDRAYGQAPPMAPEGLLAWEQQVFGLTNVQVAEAVLRGWRFPADVHVPVRDHYLRRLAVDPMRLAKCLNLAAGLAEKAGFGLPGETGYWPVDQNVFATEIGGNAEDLAAVVARAAARFEKTRAALA